MINNNESCLTTLSIRNKIISLGKRKFKNGKKSITLGKKN